MSGLIFANLVGHDLMLAYSGDWYSVLVLKWISAITVIDTGHGWHTSVEWQNKTRGKIM